MERVLPLVLLLACSSATKDGVGSLEDDLDGDGWTVDDGDCWDDPAGPDGTDGADIYPGAPDPWYDGIDSDCAGNDDFDQDEDGYVPEDYVGLPTQGVEGSGALPGGDCEDTDARLNPGAAEVCNDLDDDCNGTVDDAPDAPYWVLDEDGDGYAGNTELQACDAPDNVGLVGGDCDDGDSAIFPGADEVCNDLDDDCDDEIDEDPVDGFTYFQDLDGDGHGDLDAPTTVCVLEDGLSELSDDCDDQNLAINPDADELCNGVDDDCDGDTDEEGPETATWYVDGDGDGFADDAASSQESCAAPDETGWTLELGDCDDTDASANPEGTEVCGGGDEDCDGSVDEDNGVADGSSWYQDGDGDGYGAVDGTEVLACDAPDDGTWSSSADDCDDRNSAVHPGAEEVCNELDDNCDDIVDTDATDRMTVYTDSDRDGYGDASTETTSCTISAGLVEVDGDCDDDNNYVNPGADEICNDIDDNCDDVIDTDAIDRAEVYVDSDGDGFGADDSLVSVCELESTHVRVDGDCDDDDFAINPDAIEVCNDIDDDCDGEIDTDAIDVETVYTDADSDGFGDPATETVTCDPAADTVSNDDDCDDDDPDVYPRATEVCNGIDDDCDGEIDTDAIDLATFFVDADGDGFGDPSSTEDACEATDGLTTDDTDCDDTNAAVNPDATEVCNGIDDDCDDVVDPDYYSSDFSSDPSSDLSINNDASWRDSGYIRLTDDRDNKQGSAFLYDLVPGDLWSASFEIRIKDQDSGGGADGLTFAFLDDSVAASWVAETDGSNLGLAGATGWAVEFDNYDSGDDYGDVDSEHVALINALDMDPLVTEADPPNFDDESWMLVEVFYDGGDVEVWMDGDYVLTGTIDGTAPDWWRIGWTAATGDRNEEHDVDDVWIGCPSD